MKKIKIEENLFVFSRVLLYIESLCRSIEDEEIQRYFSALYNRVFYILDSPLIGDIIDTYIIQEVEENSR